MHGIYRFTFWHEGAEHLSVKRWRNEVRTCSSYQSCNSFFQWFWQKKTNCWGEKEICGRTDQTRGWIKSILYISTRRRFYQTFGTDRPTAKGHIERNGFISTDRLAPYKKRIMEVHGYLNCLKWGMPFRCSHNPKFIKP